jgi:hypothetical protein
MLKTVVNKVLGQRDPRINDWGSILKGARSWSDALAKNATGPKVLMATNVTGIAAASILESVLAVALKLRGAKVDVVVCDKALPACQLAHLGGGTTVETLIKGELHAGPCKICEHVGRGNFEGLGLTIHRLGKLVTEDERKTAGMLARTIPIEEIRSFKVEAAVVGEHAYAGALRFYARGSLDGEPDGELILRRYFEASLLTAYAFIKLIHEGDYDVACFHHGIYVPQGVVGEICRTNGVRVVNWNPSYRTNTFIFSHGDTYHHTLLDEPVGEWEYIPWDAEKEKAIMSYLKSRWHGTEDWIWFHEKPDEDFGKYVNDAGIDLLKPLIGMLTNVVWDAQLHYPANAFPDILAWVRETIRYFERRPDLQLLIRIHPAEIRGTLPSRQALNEEIMKMFPRLPGNVFVIKPESPVSTYAALEACDSAIIYGTKMGVELTSMGIPVVVAGEAWIRNKGVTMDASSVDEYFALLDKLPIGSRLDKDTVQRARKYAYHFFFRRMIPLPFMVEHKKPGFTLNIESLDEIFPERYPGLDVICDGIMKGTPFVYPAERYGIQGKYP